MFKGLRGRDSSCYIFTNKSKSDGRDDEVQFKHAWIHIATVSAYRPSHARVRTCGFTDESGPNAVEGILR